MSSFSLLTARLMRCAPHLARAFGTRRELALLELREAASRSAVALAVAFSAAFFFCLALVSLTVVVAAVYWDTPHRVFAVSIVAGIEALAAIVCAVWVWVSWRRWQFFQSTLDQMEQDAGCVSRIFEETEGQP